MKYKVVKDNRYPDKDILLESNNLKVCRDFVKKGKSLNEGNILVKNGRLAIGDWYGAEDNDLGWEYD